MEIDLPANFVNDPNNYVGALARGVDFAHRYGPVIRGGIQAARRAWNRRERVVNPQKKMKRAHPTGPTEAPVQNQDIGQTVGRLWACTTGRMKPKKLKLAPAVKELLVRNQYLIQALNWNRTDTRYRDNGSIPLCSQYTLGGPGFDHPVAMAFPVYVIRLSAPGSGRQYSYVTGSEQTAHPYAMYRLHGRQAAATEPWVYSWEKVGNILTGNPSDPQTGLAAGTNHYVAARSEGLLDGVHQVCHEFSDIQVLFTGAKANPVDVSCSIVSFTDSKWAPPDEFLDMATSTDRIVDENLNDPSASDTHTLADRLTPWLAGRMSHPCLQPIYGKGMTATKFWHEHAKFEKTICAVSKDNTDSAAVQYRHRHMFRPNTWMNTNCEPDREATLNGPNQIGILPTDVTTQSGLFPNPKHVQKWVMIYGFDRNPAYADGVEVFDYNKTASFDFSIRSGFAAVPQ